MKNLNIKKLDLEEMDILEMKEINGGVVLEVLLGVFVGWLLAKIVKG